MAREKIITGIDVGNSKIRTVVGVIDLEKGTPNIIGVGVTPSAGIRKGNIIDIEELIQSITASLEEAERMSGEPIHHVFASIGGSHIQMIPSQGVVAIQGNEITEADIDRVLEAAQTFSLESNRKILKIVPRSFTVDNQTNIKYPVGMSGVRMEVEAFIFTGNSVNVDHLEKALNQAGVEVGDLVPSPFCAAEAVVDKRQKELGCVVIDMGAGQTSLIVYEEGMLVHSAVLPVGGESITNDLAIGLRTSVDTAEKLKIEHGSANLKELSDHDTIDLSLISKNEETKVGKREIGTIIRARVEEIFEYVNQELMSVDRAGKLPAGAIITGSSAKIPGTLDIARDILKLPVQLGFPIEVDGIVDKIDDPAYANAIGLVNWGAKYDSPSRGLNFSGGFSKIADWFKNLLPKK